MQGDLRSLDPIWTTANITAYHGAMIYDTLFALDEQMRPQPQMVSKWGLSDDKLTYTFELRDGLKFLTARRVTADDVVASIRRWAARDGARPAHDGAREGPVEEGRQDLRHRAEGALRPDLRDDGEDRDADPLHHAQEGSRDRPEPADHRIHRLGPVHLQSRRNADGSRYVYDRIPNYVPRSEPATGMAGAKSRQGRPRHLREHAGLADRACRRCKAGEIDFFEIPPIDLIDTLESDPNIKVEVLNKTGNYGIMRLNFLHPPFDKPEARQAMLYLIDQEEFMKATFGNPKYYKKCPSNFACGTPMENDENTAWFKEAPNVNKAKELFQKAGYDGRPVTLLHATNIDFMNNAAQIAAQRLRSAGVNVQLATSDWGGVVTRRAVKTPPDQGGWNIFITWAGARRGRQPDGLHRPSGERREGLVRLADRTRTHEKLRDKWAAAGSLDEQKAIAREIQKNAWNFVPHVWLGQWSSPVAYRKNLNGVLKIPEVVPFWNIEKT